MRNRKESSSGNSEASTSGSEESTEKDGESDRHSSTPSTDREPVRKIHGRGNERGTKRKVSEGSDDDRLPAKFRRKSNNHSQRRSSPHVQDRHHSSHRRSLKTRDEVRGRTGKRDEKEYRRRSRSGDDFERRKNRPDSHDQHLTSHHRNKTRSSCSPSYVRNKEIKKEEPDEEDDDIEKLDSLRKTAREDALWAERRKERDRRCEWGVRSVWGRSPLMYEIHEIYEEYERMEKALQKEEEQLPKPLKLDASETSKKGKEGHKKKKEKSKKKHKKKHKKSSESEEEWVEVTAEMREAEAAREKMEEAAMFGPAIPDQLLQKQAALIDSTKRVNYGKDMLRGEAAAMASYIAQGKRIPRRGEIGLSSAEISEYEKIGYVMSGTRHKSMEATRLRKENQVMTAEEKRLLSGFTHDERKKKEEIVLQQFKSFIESKKGKS